MILDYFGITHPFNVGLPIANVWSPEGMPKNGDFMCFHDNFKQTGLHLHCIPIISNKWILTMSHEKYLYFIGLKKNTGELEASLLWTKIIHNRQGSAV
jgi:hypothetical protein